MHLLVVGPPRSGTTLLACMVGAHPECIMMSECFSTEEHKIVSPARVIGNKLCAPNQIQFTHPPPRVSLRRVKPRVFRWLASFVPRYTPPDLPLGRTSIRKYVQERGARLLLIVRAPGQVVESMRRRDEWGIEEAISRWARGIEEMHRAVEAFPDRTHVATFEALVESPELVMRGVSEFLELEYVPRMLEGYRRTPQYEREKIDPEAARSPVEEYPIKRREPDAVGQYAALRDRSPYRGRS